MTTEQLLLECKKGLNIPVDSTGFNSVLTQKLLAVKSFMKGAGVSDEIMADDLFVGAIVIGVTDLWNLEGGTVKFSPIFYTLVSQLVYRSKETEEDTDV